VNKKDEIPKVQPPRISKPV